MQGQAGSRVPQEVFTKVALALLVKVAPVDLRSLYRILGPQQRIYNNVL